METTDSSPTYTTSLNRASSSSVPTTPLPAVNGMSAFKETFVDILSSAVGSACCVYAGQPFDTIKVRMQLVTGGAEKVKLFSTLQTTVRQGGLAALWRGSTPALTGQLAENGVAFAINGFLKRLLQSDEADSNKSYTKPFLMGGITGVCSALVLCPCDTVKCRAQANILQGGGSSNVVDIAKELVKRDGFLGLWRGTTAQIFRDVPFYSCFFGSYDIFCHLLRKSTNWSDGTIYFLSGGFAGQIGWICSIIPDTIKSRIQVSDDPTLTIRGVFRDIVRARGILGLFTGVEVAIIRAFPANAALFVGYEYARKFFIDISS